MSDLEDVYDVEAFAREHRKLVEDLIWMTRAMVYGKYIITMHNGSIVCTEIHRYERSKVGEATG